MNLTAEKAAVIKQLEKVDDLSLVIAVKHLLEYGTNHHAEQNDLLLEASIQKGLEDIKTNMLKPHSEIMENIRSRYI